MLLRLFVVSFFLATSAGVCGDIISEAISQIEVEGSWDWTSWIAGPNCTSTPPLVDLTAEDLQPMLARLELLGPGLEKALQKVGLDLGFSMEVVYRQQTVFSRGYGTVKKGEGAVPDRDTVYRIGSISKIFTSMYMMAGVDAGALHTSDLVSSVYNASNPPEWKIVDPFEDGRVSLAQLAAHASGLPREAFGCRFISTCEEKPVFDVLAHLPRLYPAYTKPHYSNLGSALLGRSVARKFGEGFEEGLVRRVIKPLAMPSTGFNFTDDIRSRLAQGYLLVPNGGGLDQKESPYTTVDFGWVNPAGGMYSTVADLGQFMKSLFAQTAPLRPATRREYLLPSQLFPTGVSGFGAASFEQYYVHGRWVQTKGGLAGGYGSSVAFDPELQVGVAFAINAMDGADPDAATTFVMNTMIPGLLKVLGEKARTYPLLPNATQLAGTYAADGIVFMTLDATPQKDNSLHGTIPFLTPAPVTFWYAPELDTEGALALRYAFGGSQSCTLEYGSGDGGVALFEALDGTPVVSLYDQALFRIPKTA